MAALLLANIHAPDFKPAITLTDLRDRHAIFWLDGFSIMYYVIRHQTLPQLGPLPRHCWYVIQKVIAAIHL